VFAFLFFLPMSMGRLGQRQALDIYDEISKDKIATPGVAGAITDDRAEPRATEMPSQGARVGAGRDRATCAKSAGVSWRSWGCRPRGERRRADERLRGARGG
jgi:hypothetical protein